jgi:hypothetical protein
LMSASGSTSTFVWILRIRKSEWLRGSVERQPISRHSVLWCKWRTRHDSNVWPSPSECNRDRGFAATWRMRLAAGSRRLDLLKTALLLGRSDAKIVTLEGADSGCFHRRSELFGQGLRGRDMIASVPKLLMRACREPRNQLSSLANAATSGRMETSTPGR